MIDVQNMQSADSGRDAENEHINRKRRGGKLIRHKCHAVIGKTVSDTAESMVLAFATRAVMNRAVHVVYRSTPPLSSVSVTARGNARW